MAKRITSCGQFALLLLLAVFLVSCSNVKPYHSDLEKNFRIEPKIISGKESKAPNTDLNIYDVNSRCEVNYVGSVHLSNEPVEIGLPVTRPVYLELSFFNPGGLFQSPSTATYPIFLRPSSGRKYVAEVSYIDDFYKLKLWEGGHAIEIKSLDACQKSKVN